VDRYVLFTQHVLHFQPANDTAARIRIFANQHGGCLETRVPDFDVVPALIGMVVAPPTTICVVPSIIVVLPLTENLEFAGIVVGPGMTISVVPLTTVTWPGRSSPPA